MKKMLIKLMFLVSLCLGVFAFFDLLNEAIGQDVYGYIEYTLAPENDTGEVSQTFTGKYGGDAKPVIGTETGGQMHARGSVYASGNKNEVKADGSVATSSYVQSEYEISVRLANLDGEIHLDSRTGTTNKVSSPTGLPDVSSSSKATFKGDVVIDAVLKKDDGASFVLKGDSKGYTVVWNSPNFRTVGAETSSSSRFESNLPGVSQPSNIGTADATSQSQSGNANAVATGSASYGTGPGVRGTAYTNASSYSHSGEYGTSTDESVESRVTFSSPDSWN